MPDYFVDTRIIYEQLKAATIYPIVSQISVGVTIPLCSLTEFSINVGKFSERNIFRIVLLTVELWTTVSTFIILSQT